ncbi:MAG: hypothetical protein GX545_06760 [Fibrobacter sp.]|nr:hypothetical protein [Fibrobacter sp.]
MTPEFKSKILNDLNKSGFHSEMKAIQIFQQAEWICNVSAGYFDKDEEKSREIDVSAYRGIVENQITCFIHIIADVKKSDKPWLVFKNNGPWYQTIESKTILNILNLKLIANDLWPILSTEAISGKLKWVGYGIHECFKEPNVNSKWYSSFVSVIKACEDLGNTKWEPFSKNNSKVIVLVKPVVILDGTLLAAGLNSSNEVDVSNVPYASVDFYYKSQRYSREDYRIDVVTLDRLKEYLDIYENVSNHIRSVAYSKINQA